MNIGVQREVWKGGIFSADYVRNVGDHFMQAVDLNHVGDASTLNTTAAINAIDATLSACHRGSIELAILFCPGLYQPNPNLPYYHPGLGANI